MIFSKRRFIDYVTQGMSDKLYFQLNYFLRFRRFPDLINPESFNEKVIWRILFDRDSQYTKLGDKVGMREYVSKLGLGAHLPETYYIGNDPSEIPFDNLPASFVAKPSHSSGRIVIVEDKAAFEQNKFIATCKTWLSHNFYQAGREWHYKNMIPRIIVEEFIGAISSLQEYKFHCFQGKSRIVSATSGLYGTENYYWGVYDENWVNHHLAKSAPNVGSFPRPARLQEMLELAAEISNDIDYVRVDLYALKDRILVGELTFTPLRGLYRHWGELETKLGKLWDLDTNKSSLL